MNLTQRGIAILLRCAVTGEKLPLPEGFDLGQAMDTVNAHHIHTLFFEGAVRCGLDKKSEPMQRLFQIYLRSLAKSEGQLRQLKRIFAAFDEAGVDYMPLKGSRMKYRYPKPELRTMGDADILIRREQYDRITPIMEALGFTFSHESDHELIWLHPQLMVELHKWVIPSYNEDFYAYFGDGWRLATVCHGTRYAMKPEDEWIYMLTHFAKHFRDGGIGCRHVVDLWVFLRSNPGLDEGYIAGELEKLRLAEFYDNIRALTGVWFADGAGDDRTELMTDYIFASGSWGDEDSKLLSREVKRSKHALPGMDGKAVYLWQQLFLKREYMERDYPVLKKHPWLLPALWAYRPVKRLIIDGHKLDLHKKNLEVISKESVRSREQMLQFVGLDYWF